MNGLKPFSFTRRRTLYYAQWVYEKGRLKPLLRFSDGLCRKGRVCRPKAAHAFLVLQAASPNKPQNGKAACTVARHTLYTAERIFYLFRNKHKGRLKNICGFQTAFAVRQGMRLCHARACGIARPFARQIKEAV
ncbi:hypothetical protein [Kingella potus]|uniref:hypothetical protein n=1 Tax=Kingella potus TaxID=265175 RepID=UPI001FD2973D|nr:hypothetical protein [Kingella potus]UOP00753.1 hypothetical protein LVJ84_13415 [Kingella potus]